MESNESLTSNLRNNNEETTPATSEPVTAHISSLLTVEPILEFQRDFVPIATLAYNFRFINTTICTFLSEDTHADDLRALLSPFNEHAFEVATELRFALIQARCFYVHDAEEMKQQAIPDVIPDEKAQKILDPKFQSNAKDFALEAATGFQSAKQLLEDKVLPRLSDIEYALTEYVEEYCIRYEIMQERSQSWIPLFLQDILWGVNDPTTWNISEVEVLPKDFASGCNNLKKLPDLLNRMQTHFMQLSELDMSRVGSLGYSTTLDLHRLYRDRLECHSLLRDMDKRWDPAIKAFPVPFVRSRDY